MDQVNPSVKRFLCVDLDEGFFYLIRSYSERSGCMALSLARGKDDLELIKQTLPDVFILEADDWVNDPAWEFIKRIHDDVELRSIPIMLFSWLDDEESALEKGADIFVRKPVMLVNFQDALNSVGICIERPSVEPLQANKEVRN